jgi:hypothetical protein
MHDDKKALAEMAQGVLIAARNGRADALFRLANHGLIEIHHDRLNNKQQVWLDLEPIGTLLAECENDNNFPTEEFMAWVALGLHAHGVRVPERPAPREASGAKYVITWKESK